MPWCSENVRIRMMIKQMEKVESGWLLKQNTMTPLFMIKLKKLERSSTQPDSNPKLESIPWETQISTVSKSPIESQ